MELLLSDIIYQVYWRYSSERKKLPNDQGQTDQEITTCYVAHKGEPPFKSTSVIRYYKTPSNRDQARRYSLTKLLEELDMPRDKRTIFQEAYNKLKSPIIKSKIIQTHESPVL